MYDPVGQVYREQYFFEKKHQKKMVGSFLVEEPRRSEILSPKKGTVRLS